jgi:predicted aminopeptidase
MAVALQAGLACRTGSYNMQELRGHLQLVTAKEELIKANSSERTEFEVLIHARRGHCVGMNRSADSERRKRPGSTLLDHRI